MPYRAVGKYFRKRGPVQKHDEIEIAHWIARDH